jgi:hypothetical protein
MAESAKASEERTQAEREYEEMFLSQNILEAIDEMAVDMKKHPLLNPDKYKSFYFPVSYGDEMSRYLSKISEKRRERTSKSKGTAEDYCKTRQDADLIFDGFIDRMKKIWHGGYLLSTCEKKYALCNLERICVAMYFACESKKGFADTMIERASEKAFGLSKAEAM